MCLDRVILAHGMLGSVQRLDVPGSAMKALLLSTSLTSSALSAHRCIGFSIEKIMTAVERMLPFTGAVCSTFEQAPSLA
eukprot:8825048-Lingulodinium_polyedra.AAC.1